jgi:hypothetical protein
MNWQEAVLAALNRYATRHGSRLVTRQQLISEELDQIIRDTGASGATPPQTLSRVLQELQDTGFIHFTQRGAYLLLDNALDVSQEALPPDAIDAAIKHNKLLFGEINTQDIVGLTRQRLGQQRLRRLTLMNYRQQCAFCDTNQKNLLIAGHIARWRDEPNARGHLTNVMCMCRFHDTLFEYGFFSLTDDYTLLKKTVIHSKTIELLLENLQPFQVPLSHPPSAEYLQKHRERTGF